MAEISPVKYSKELQNIIFPDNSFYKKSVQETGIADTVETVQRPYQGSIGKAKSGAPATLPLQVAVARDSSDSYSTTLVYAPPIAVDLPDEFALNYNKRQSKQAQQAAIINTRVAEIAAVNWGPTEAANLVKTTGSSRASNIIKAATGVIGNRKALVKADMLKVYNLLLRMNVMGIAGNFYGLVTADSYTDLLSIAEFTDYDKLGQTSKLEKGIVGRIMGFEIMVRATEDQSIGLMYNVSSVKNAIDAAVLTNDLPANLFWHDKMTASAEGMLKTSINVNAPGYLGATIIETWTRFGASWARYDQKGVVALLEDNA